MSAAHMTAVRRGFIREGSICQEVVQRFLDDRLHVQVVGTCLINAVFGFLQREHIAVFIFDSGVVDIVRKRFCQRIGDRLFLFRKITACSTHHPFISFIRGVEVCDRAPAHGAKNRIADALNGADGLKIGLIQRAVARSAHDRGLCASAGHTECEDGLRIARHRFITVADVPDRRFEIGDTGRCAGISAPASGMDIDKSGIGIVRHIGIITQRSLGAVARGIDRHDDRRSGCRVAVHRAVSTERTGIGAVSVILCIHIRTRHKYRKCFIGTVRRVLAVCDTNLVVHIIIRVILPCGAVDHRKPGGDFCLFCFSCFRSCFLYGFCFFILCGALFRCAAGRKAQRQTADHTQYCLPFHIRTPFLFTALS